jgi:hypothetical protein
MMETLAGQEPLSRIEQFLDDYFRVRNVPTDPAFSRFIPMVYDPIAFSGATSSSPVSYSALTA